ncbi:MAG: inorganic phosphate transporter [Candidatus Sericytochromatia bacterium]|nr:inorganic phosphate transporter [Candidatus Sericytochromatia bacterium]
MDLLLIILILGILAAGFQAWNIGANDVANALGTSVGSKALTFKKAIIIAAIFEFLGAVLVGSHVSDTLRKGIVDPAGFEGQPELLALAMLAALLAAGTALLVATLFALPISTTHSIVGAVVGVGLIALGPAAVDWPTVGQVASSWIISPVAGGLAAFTIFTLLRRHIFNSPHPLKAFKRISPLLIFSLVTVVGMSILFKGLKNLKLDLNFGEALPASMLIAGVVAGISYLLIRRIPEVKPLETNRFGTGQLRAEFGSVEKVFMKMQVLSACSMAFAHGSNDVANAIGPLAVIASVYQTGQATASDTIPMWVVLLGGVGIVIGLATYGYKVIQTIGQGITELTPARGFAAELAAATTILLGSKLGLPISTTHTLVGAVIGIGLAQGLEGVNRKVVINIINSWVMTVPFAALVAIVIFQALRLVMGI